jgi:hypothetical protein
LWTKSPDGNTKNKNKNNINISINNNNHQNSNKGDAYPPPLSTASNDDGFVQTLDVAGGKVTIVTADGYNLQVYVDANAPVVRVSGTHTKGFAAKASLELYKFDANWVRNETRPYAALSTIGSYNESTHQIGSYCEERFLEPDTVVAAADVDASSPLLKEKVAWYHMNQDTKATHGVPTYYENVMRAQGLEPAHFKDPLLHRTFGAVMGGAGYVRNSDGGGDVSVVATVAAGAESNLEIVLHTVEACTSEAGWLAAMAATVEAEANRGTVPFKEAAHASTWESLWQRSHVDISIRSDAYANNNDSNNNNNTTTNNNGTKDDPKGTKDSTQLLTNAGNVEAVNDAYVWQRFMDLADGRNTWGVIKFNGQAFTTSLNGTQEGQKKGVVSADYRDWGPSNWIQNTRQPYYAALAAGDSDIMSGILKYFNRSMEVARARVNATFGIGGAYWPETSTLFGTYEAAFLGYGCNGAGAAPSPPTYTNGGRADRHGAPATVPAVNGYTRFYSSGSIEICFLGLEEYYTSLDTATLQDYTLPICDAVMQFYRERFPYVNTTTGKTDMFPAQVIESFWCGNGGSGTNAWGHVDDATGKLTKPYSRDECPTDGAPDVAGLHAVLGKLLALPSAAVPPSYARSVAAWNKSLALLPPLTTELCHYGGVDGPGKPSLTNCRKQNKQGSWCNGHTPCSPPTNVSTIVAIAGQLSDAIRQHNHENHAAYAIWPFRQYGVGKPNLEVGQATYMHRPHPCNHNWCQDLTDAAMLNLSTDAANQVVGRATAPPLRSLDGLSRFGGYSQHYEDYSPAVDHLSGMRIALHEMLMGRLDDVQQTITVFPGWPADVWDVDFKLKGPLNTTVEAACVRGVVTKLIVIPASRRRDVVVHNCKQGAAPS